MKPTVALFAVLLILGSAAFPCAQDNSSAAEITGWICHSRCVKWVDGRATCDTDCHTGILSGRPITVFVDDQGKTTRIANPKLVSPFMGKKVKVKCDFKKGKMRVYDVQLANPE
jgi:hypothetical protein